MNLSLDTPTVEIPFLAGDRIKKGSKVLITGATGFVGSRLAEILSIQFGCEVYAMVRDYSRAVKLSHLPIRFIYGDLRNDTWKKQLPAKIDYIFHCAYGSSGSGQEREKTDLSGTKNLLNAVAVCAPHKFVFLSTVSVFAQKNTGVIDENSNLKPIDDYGRNKLGVERLIAVECKKLNIPFCVLRPSAIIGPGAPSYVNRILREIRSHIVVFMHRGEGKLNWIYIDDVVGAMINAACIPKSDSKTYVLSNPQPLTYIEYYRTLALSAGENLHYQFMDRTENKQLLKRQKVRISQIIISAIDVKKFKPLMKIPLLSGLLGILNKIRKIFLKPEGKQKKQLSAQSSRTLLPVPEEYANFLSSEAVFISRHLISDQLLSGYTNFEQTLRQIKLKSEWETSWQD